MAKPGIKVSHGASNNGVSLQNRLKKEAGVSAVDFVESGMVLGLGTGSTTRFAIEELGKRARGNTPEDIRVAVPWFKPSRNETDLLPDYYLRETDEWLVFPRELDSLTPEELERYRPGIAAIVHKVKSPAKSA